MRIFDRVVEKLYLKQKGNLAFYDTLTGIKNRTYYDMIIRPTYCVKECYVAYVDINNLKQCNDKFGHAAGDELILNVVEQLKKIKVKELCRIGGDEFILISEQEIKQRELDNAEIGIYKKCKFEDISSGVAKADGRCRRKKQYGGILNEFSR